MAEKSISALRKAFNAAVTGQINDDRQHGWGAADSMAAIEAIVAEDATQEIAALIAAGKKPEGYTLSDEALSLIKSVVNPSAFRQILEKALRPDGKTVLAKSDKARIEKEAFDLYA